MKTESELSSHVRQWLKEDGWETYGEVLATPGRADIVGERKPLVCVVEAKLHLNLRVMEQAYRWVQSANLVYVAVPKPKQVNVWALHQCHRLGFGVLLVSSQGRVEDRIKAPFHRKIDSFVKDALSPEQKDSVSGTNKGGYHTPFKKTCENLKELVRKNNGTVCVKKAMKELDHHYSTDASARACLINLIEKGVVEGLVVRREGKEIYFETPKR